MRTGATGIALILSRESARSHYAEERHVSSGKFEETRVQVISCKHPDCANVSQIQ
jgi:hypothetical protein